jgi:hypothetical protein
MRVPGGLLLALSSCHLVGDVHDVGFVDEVPAATGGQPCEASACPAGECQSPLCAEGACAVANRPAHEPCSAGVCDGQGSCVACVDNGDCPSGPCQDGLCVAEACVDGAQNGMETDVDCGGGCAPCADGEACVLPADCASGVCVDFVCGACTDGSCQPGSYCDEASGTCAMQKPLGAPCSSTEECTPPYECDDECVFEE